MKLISATSILAASVVLLSASTASAAPLLDAALGVKPLGAGLFRSISGDDREDMLGATNTTLSRMASRTDTDPLGNTVDASTLPNPRTISNALGKLDAVILSQRGLSDIAWSWGQFLDHDLSLSEHGERFGVAPIEIPFEDDDFLVESGCTFMEFTRSEFRVNETDGGREQVNNITSFIDASNVYGSDEQRAAALRTFKNGMMKVSKGKLLPFNENGLRNAGGASEDFFLAGDLRGNEQISLLSLHTLFIREHNFLARKMRRLGFFKRFNKVRRDEWIYQIARKIVGAELQIITYTEFLPAYLGEGRAPLVEDYLYNPILDPRLTNEFTTALYRFGHSSLSPTFSLPDYDLNISQAFFNISFFTSDKKNIDNLFRSLATTPSQDVDTRVIDDVRDLLFSADGETTQCMDLLALNLQRARDHQILPYNQARQALGLARKETFEQINLYVADKLASVYETVDDVDLWIGAMAETHEPDSSFGELLITAFQEQFTRLRDADPFFYTGDPVLQHPLVRSLINLKRVTLGRVISRNTKVKEFKRTNVFFATPAEYADDDDEDDDVASDDISDSEDSGDE